MKKIKVIDLIDVKYGKMNEKINEELQRLQEEGKNIIDFKVHGSALNKIEEFVFYE